MSPKSAFAITFLLIPSMLAAAPVLADVDTISPVVNGVTPTTAQVNAAQMYSVNYMDNVGVSTCNLYVNGTNRGSMNLSGSMATGTASAVVTFVSAGSYNAQAQCADANGNIGLGMMTTVVVSAVPMDSSVPSVDGINPTNAQLNVSQTYTVTYNDNVGVTSCNLFVDGTDRGMMSLAGSATSGSANLALGLSSSGTHAFQARCRDASGNVTSGNTTTVTIGSAATVDLNSPSMPGNLNLISANTNQTASFVWNASTDNTAVTGYDVQVDGGGFLNIGSVFNYTTGVLVTGSHSFNVRAHDAAGNVSGVGTVAFVVGPVPSPSPSPAPSPSPLPTQPPFALSQFSTDAHVTVTGGRTDLLTSTGQPSCEMAQSLSDTRTFEVFGTLDTSMKTSVSNFIGCGTQTSLRLGAGERIGIINSFRAAFGRVPMAEADWNDVIKIGNGRFPGQTSATAEASARARFRQVYLREPNLNVASDNNAVTIMAYGLRPNPRNLNAEAAAILTYRAIFKAGPVSATEWDTVRAIAYSGATR